MQRKTSILGVLMCGGKSTRMGRDKGLISFQDKTWASLGAEKLSALGIPVVYSIHPGQVSHYAVLHATFVTDDPDLPAGGPLLGLLSVHQRFPDEDLFLLACDLPFMEEDVLQRLLKAYSQNPGYDAYLFGTQEAPEPVCAIYNASALNNTSLTAGTNSSLKYWLGQWKVLITTIPEGKEYCFGNINTPQDLGG
jgi:molybdopterin-guanine dinucleotide biosynthesis protein A